MQLWTDSLGLNGDPPSFYAYWQNLIGTLDYVLFFWRQLGVWFAFLDPESWTMFNKVSFSFSPQLTGLLLAYIHYSICIYPRGTPVSSFFRAVDLSFSFLHGMSKNTKLLFTHSVLTLSRRTWHANETNLQGEQCHKVCLQISRMVLELWSEYPPHTPQNCEVDISFSSQSFWMV